MENEACPNPPTLVYPRKNTEKIKPCLFAGSSPSWGTNRFESPTGRQHNANTIAGPGVLRTD